MALITICNFKIYLFAFLLFLSIYTWLWGPCVHHAGVCPSTKHDAWYTAEAKSTFVEWICLWVAVEFCSLLRGVWVCVISWSPMITSFGWSPSVTDTNIDVGLSIYSVSFLDSRSIKWTGLLDHLDHGTLSWVNLGFLDHSRPRCTIFQSLYSMVASGHRWLLSTWNVASMKFHMLWV